MKPVEIISEGQKLQGNIFYPKLLKEKNPAIIFIHGWTSGQYSTTAYANMFRDLGFICLTFDLRGHGESKIDPYTFSRTNFMNDVLSAYDYLVSLKGVDQNNINVVGSSFGGYLAALLTEKRKIKNICMRVPANYTDEDFNVPWTNKRFDENGQLSLKSLSSFNGNVLVVESEKDEQVTHETVQNYVDAVKDTAKITFVVMKGAPHSISKDEKRTSEFIAILKDWFKKL